MFYQQMNKIKYNTKTIDYIKQTQITTDEHKAEQFTDERRFYYK